MEKDKRTKILEAAATIFAQKGFAPAKIADIAAAAGIGKGTVYEYFPSKENLLEEVFIYFFSKMEKELQTPQEDPFKQICFLITESLNAINEMEDLVFLTIDFWAASFKDNSSRIHTLLKEMHHAFLQQISTSVEEGKKAGIFKHEVETEYFAMLLFSMIDEFFLHRSLLKGTIDINKFAQECIEICRYRLLKNPMEN